MILPPDTPQDNPIALSRLSRIIFIPETVAFGGAERSCLALSRWLYTHQVNHSLLLYIDHINIASMACHPLTVVQLKPRMRAMSKVKSLHSYQTPEIIALPIVKGSKEYFQWLNGAV